MNNLSKEYAILSATMFPLCEEQEDIRHVYLNEKYFSNGFTKLIARTINNLNTKHEYCDSLAVESFASRDQNFNHDFFIELLAFTPITYTGIIFYMRELKKDFIARKLNV